MLHVARFHLQTPEVFEEFTNETETDPSDTTLYNHTAVLDVQPHPTHICINLDGLNTTCDFSEPPAPSLEDGVCYNVVVQVQDHKDKSRHNTC